MSCRLKLVRRHLFHHRRSSPPASWCRAASSRRHRASSRLSLWRILRVPRSRRRRRCRYHRTSATRRWSDVDASPATRQQRPRRRRYPALWWASHPRGSGSTCLGEILPAVQLHLSPLHDRYSDHRPTWPYWWRSWFETPAFGWLSGW